MRFLKKLPTFKTNSKKNYTSNFFNKKFNYFLNQFVRGCLKYDKRDAYEIMSLKLNFRKVYNFIIATLFYEVLAKINQK